MNNNTLEGRAPSGVEMIDTPSVQFRSLRANEVEVRPAECRDGKATLLLYQDARCAMNILDDTLGRLGWQKEYYEAKGLLLCRIGIRDSDTGEWIWKSDTGSESNIEADKGLVSDAFKRAAVSWGIGRELYSAPRITIPLTDKDSFNGRVSQKFIVGEMSVENGEITSLTIVDKWGKERFRWDKSNEANVVAQASSKDTPIPPLGSSKKRLKDFCTEMKGVEGVDIQQLTRFYNFYSSPSKDDASKTVEESFKYFDAPKLWDKWMSKQRAA